MKSSNSSKPINYGDFAYWDDRYSKKKGERFEWLQPYIHLKPFIEECLPKGKQSHILNLGCGNSIIQQHLYEDGYHNIVSNDISSVVIEEMKASQKQKGFTQMTYQVMDVRKMTYKSDSFDLIIDKSTIDSLMCSDHPLLNVAQTIEEGYRVLKEGGYFFTISYSQERTAQFQREHVRFEITSKQLKHTHEEGHQASNYLYICKKIPMQKLTPEQHTTFYTKLEELQLKDYPPA